MPLSNRVLVPRGIVYTLLLTSSIWLSLAESAQCPPVQYSVIGSKTSGFSACSANHFVTATEPDATTWPYRKYATLLAQPPFIKINQTGYPLSTGLIFITPEILDPVVGKPVPAALITTSDGDLVWSISDSSPGAMIINLQPQRLHGKPVITYWNGTQGDVQGYGAGTVEILNENYDRIFSVCPKLSINLKTPIRSTVSCFCDYHEAQITSDNTILITVYNTTKADLTSVGGAEDGYIVESLAVEVDLETNEPLFVWRASDHVPISHTRSPLEQTGTEDAPFDWFHINSIHAWNGGFIINSRHTWTTYYVSRQGDILWRVNGADGGDFGSLPDLGQFSWQHDARPHGDSERELELTYFANNDDSADGHGSMALTLLLTIPPRMLEPPVLMHSLYEPGHRLVAHAGGSHLVLPNGNHLVGYGDLPIMREFGPAVDGGWEVRWTAQLPYTRHSYRAYKQDWHATPSTRPALMVRTVVDANQLDHCAYSPLRGYVSWNGATDVSQYLIYIDFGNGEMNKFVTVARQGFETEFLVPRGAVRVQVAARECPASDEIRRSNIFFVQ